MKSHATLDKRLRAVVTFGLATQRSEIRLLRNSRELITLISPRSNQRVLSPNRLRNGR